ncbi:hypothetical protein KDA_59390 [Dictyobacter alpinus]|uniref:Uncharacterized protein n=1 Tax=Dictyobacter alpinus TaxID=2014873 RepID=A0A402BGF5_9CHLR|nr:hypothetical protein KDA_59390 [Dictyobacter alpinus]
MITIRFNLLSLLVVLAMLMLLVIGSQLPDIKRYLRMRAM